MRIEEMDVFIKADGEVAYEVRGVKGKSCLNLVEGVKQDLGNEVLSQEATSEMYEQGPDIVIHIPTTTK
jgi:hypothetical protein